VANSSFPKPLPKAFSASPDTACPHCGTRNRAKDYSSSDRKRRVAPLRCARWRQGDNGSRKWEQKPMNILTVNLLFSTFVFWVAARIYALPKLAELSPQTFLLPILLLHAFRHLG